MSANTSIKEGGQARSFGPVAALMVQGDDGKYLPWVPESERQLDTKSISKNGVYQAKKDGVYGWRSFHVNVPTDQGVTGTDPTTGQQVAVGVDPTTGELTETAVPVEIRITTPPSQLSYTDGEQIIMDGAIITAYDASGNEMQIVPLSEITIHPVTALLDESIYTKEYIEIQNTSFPALSGFVPMVAVGSNYKITTEGDSYDETIIEGGKRTALFVGKNKGCLFIAASDIPFTCIMTMVFEKGGKQYKSTYGSHYATFGSTVYYVAIQTGIGDGEIISADPYNTTDMTWSTSNTKFYAQRIAWELIYGDIIDHRSGYHQTITVSWPRPGDGAVLETTFDILVGPHGGTGDD